MYHLAEHCNSASATLVYDRGNICCTASQSKNAVQDMSCLIHEIRPKQGKRAAARYQTLSSMEKHKHGSTGQTNCPHAIPTSLQPPQKKMPREDT